MKHAMVTPTLRKPGLNDNCLANYRPISNLSFLSKTLERYVAAEQRYYIDINGYNDPFQSAYRPKHSTETAVLRIHEDLTQAVDSRRGVLLVLLDLSAAFDTLHHSTLLHRLRAIDLSQTVLAWFMSYLAGRTNSVKISDVTSAPVIIQHGVPQNSVHYYLTSTCYPLRTSLIATRSAIIYTQMTHNCTLSVRHRITQMHNGKSTNAQTVLDGGWMTTTCF